MPPGASGYYTNSGGNLPQVDGGYYTNGGGNMPPGMDANASRIYGREGNSMNVTGYSLNSLLATASPADGATNVTFIGTGGVVEVVPLSEIRAQVAAAIVVTGPGMLMAFVPGTPDNSTVIGLISIIIS
jgi:hypothetical protein